MILRELSSRRNVNREDALERWRRKKGFTGSRSAQYAVALAPGAVSVRVWQILSRGPRATRARPRRVGQCCLRSARQFVKHNRDRVERVTASRLGSPNHRSAALMQERNKEKATVDWCFSMSDAREKLSHLCPSESTL